MPSDIIKITATQKSAPPGWAIMERHLIDTMNEAAPEFLNKYADRGGRMPTIGKPDDMYEVFGNWPLFYIIGGNEELFELSFQQWNAITRQLTYGKSKRVDREFVMNYDWFHNSESYKYFYYFGLADPQIPENIDRAKRFAAMYMGDDPLAQNYDPEFKIMKSPLTGSTGPWIETKRHAEYMLNYGHASLYPIIKEYLEPGWEKDPEKAEEINKLYNEVVTRGDTPISLNACALIANAYLYTGEEKYKDWIIGYVDAWLQRIEDNNGILPDNIGLTGKIGEYRDGQWWGGHFGWSARYSQHMIFGALTSAAETAYLVTGDSKYLSLLRSQIDVLFDNSKRVDKQLVFPYRYGSDGWYDYRPLEIRELSHLYNMSIAPDDWKRIETVLGGFKYGPRPYKGYNDFELPMTGWRTFRWESNGEPMDFTQVVSNGDIGDEHMEQEELNEAPRQLFLAGRNPDFPEKILEANYREMLRRITVSRSIEDIYSYPGLISEELAGLNPVVTKGLVFLTMGGPQAIYNGGLLQVRVRYYDADKKHPGLPEGVAALVEKLTADRTVLQLVNTSALESHAVIIQAGAYGEHEFTEAIYAEYSAESNGDKNPEYKSLRIDNKYFLVELPPATSISLDIGTRRYVNTPSYKQPW
ncbi:MAG: hypothetical protein JXB48_22570 [Candidatus Latescibacteria bacterium]|nr:hypothetical protein [Candidatus Latescibacterota bacterium]